MPATVAEVEDELERATPMTTEGNMEFLIVLALAVLAFTLFILLLFFTERSRTFLGRLTLRWWRWVERLRRRGGPRT